MAKKKGRIKVAGYSQRTFFNDNIEYRNFSDDLVGLQFASVDGAPLFTMGNFSITTNLSPKLNKTYNTGTYSPFFTLDDLDEDDTQSLVVQKQQIAGLNLNLTDPLSYVWYGSSAELIRVSLEHIKKYFPAAIYVDNKVGSVVGNNITNYSYNSLADESTFTVSSNYFVNPFNIQYTIDEGQKSDEENLNKLRNLNFYYKSYTIEHNGIIKNIKSFSAATQTTNSEITLVVEGNPFPEITGINFSQFYFLNNLLNASIPFFIKPNEVERENFFTSLNPLEVNMLNREVIPIYTSTFSVPEETDSGVIVYTQKQITFPVLEDGYNLDFFDGLYISYLDTITKIGDDLDKVKTDLIKRKYTAEVITGFDTIPRGDGDDLTLDGAKATKLLRIYGVSFDEVKKYINGIKFAHVVTYNKEENTPDSLVKDLAFMLGLEKVDFLTHLLTNKNILPSEGMGQFSGTSTNLSMQQIDIELYRRLILNVAWLWKSKGARKAIEFLFRFIGAPESLVSFDEHIVIADKPVNIPKLKQLLYLYTGSSDDINEIPFDDNGFPLPPPNGSLVVLDWIEGTSIVYEDKDGTELTPDELEKCGSIKKQIKKLESHLTTLIENNSSDNDLTEEIEEIKKTITILTQEYHEFCSNIITNIEENTYTDMYFQKAGGWYRETGGLNPQIDIRTGNNPHVGPYDGGYSYLAQFTNCPLPDFQPKTTYSEQIQIIKENQFVNYNYGFINGIPNDTELFITLLEGNNNQFIPNCIDVTTNIVTAPKLQGGTTVYQEALIKATAEYEKWLEKIEADCGLIYSPEWQIVKHNYEIASSNYGKELISAECNVNQALEICLDIHTFPIIDNPVTSCELYTPIYENGFIYFVTEDGNEILFDGFETCCVGAGGQYYSYITVSNENGYFCAYDTPCIGKVSAIRDDGVILWESEGTNVSEGSGIYQVGDSCVKPTWDGTTSGAGQKNWTFCTAHMGIGSDGKGGFYTPGTPQFDIWVHNNPSLVQNTIPWCFTPVDCNSVNTFMETTVECCVYNNYDYQIITVWEGETSRNIIVCVERKSNADGDTKEIEIGDGDVGAIRRELDNVNKRQKDIETYEKEHAATITSDEQSKIDLEKNNLEITQQTLSDQEKRIEAQYRLVNTLKTDKGYTEYQPNTNLNASLQDADVPAVLNNTRGSYIMGITDHPIPGQPKESSPADAVDFGSVWNIPELMNCNQWKVKEIDEYGRVTFTPVDATIEVTDLNWLNTKEEGANLYRECCLSKGYEFDRFLLNPTNNQLVRAEEAMEFQGTKFINACVDPSYVTCDELKDLKLILGNDLQNGFYLPNDEYNDSHVDIRFDYMIKYDPESLIECATANSCGISLDLYKNSLYNLDCPNFIVFTESEELKNTLEDNINYVDTDFLHLSDSTEVEIDEDGNPISKPTKKYGDGIPNIIPHWNTQNIQVWQTPGIQYENEECCNALGGVFVDGDEWETAHGTWVKNIKNQYIELLTTIRRVYDSGEAIPATNDINFPSWATAPMIQNIRRSLKNRHEWLTIFRQQCVNYSQFKSEPFCDHIFDNLITTEHVCMLEAPVECGIYTLLLTDYWTQINVVQVMIRELEICGEGKVRVGEILEELERAVITKKSNKSNDEHRKTEEINVYDTELDKYNKQLDDVNIHIREIDDTNVAINSVTGTDAEELDCNRYYQQTQLIKNFDVKGYCKAQMAKTTQADNDSRQIYNECVTSKNEELGEELKTYNSLYESCIRTNELNSDITASRESGNVRNEEEFTRQYNKELEKLNTLEDSTTNCPSLNTLNEELLNTNSQQNNVLANVDKVSSILDVSADSIRDGNVNLLEPSQVIELQRVESVNNSNKNKLLSDKNELNQKISKINADKEEIVNEWAREERRLDEDIDKFDKIRDNLYDEYKRKECCDETLALLRPLLNDMMMERIEILNLAEEAYTAWYEERYANYQNYLTQQLDNVLTFIDDLKIKFTLEVDNNVIGTVPPSLIHANLNTLSTLTDRINPIWEWDPQPYSGVIIEGNEYSENIVKDAITQALLSQGYDPINNLFTPQWQTLNFGLDKDMCAFLNMCYPGKQFFIGIEIENYECDVCLLVDNLQINSSVDKLSYLYNTEECPMPELRCVIDNKKSWVYYDKGVNFIDYEILPGRCLPCKLPCNIEFETSLKERLWQHLEYRYTNYEFPHSDLIINSKSTVFNIDPAKSIECDVYNFWQNIDCDECPTSCSSGETITYEGKVRLTPTDSLTGYTISLSGSPTGTIAFDCDTYTDILTNQITELKDEVYTLTADYGKAISATYSDLLTLGGSLDEFNIIDNNCGGQTIVMGNYKDINNLNGLLVEDSDGTISFWDMYVYDNTTPYGGGEVSEIVTGISAQTFNQTSGMTSECCKTLNTLLSSDGKYGMGLDKNYVWSDSLSACTWRDINDCEGDCSFSGLKTINAGVAGGEYKSAHHTLSFVQVSADTVDVYYDSTEPISAFHMVLETNGGSPILPNINQAYGGDAGAVGMLFSENFSDIITFDLVGLTIPAGSGLLMKIEFVSDVTTAFNTYNGNIMEVCRISNDTITTIPSGTTTCGGDVICDGTYNVLDVVTMINGLLTNSGLEGASLLASGFPCPTCAGNMSGADGVENVYGLVWGILNGTSYGDDVFGGFEDISLVGGTCAVEQVPICVTPVDFLDTPPSKIQVKAVFDEMVQRNLIDATNRQTLSGYPTLELFYQLYLTANNCGKELSGKLTYNNLFQFMDLIGDYWLELLEQAIPATTIMEGCGNSGKVYRNTIFDNNKFVYKKYSINYFTSGNTCHLSGVTSQSIGHQNLDVQVQELCLNGECMGTEIKGCNRELSNLDNLIKEKEEKVNELQFIIDSGGANCGYTPQQLTDLEISIILYYNELTELKLKRKEKYEECKSLELDYIAQQEQFNNQQTECEEIAQQLVQAKEELNSLTEGTLPYNQQLEFIEQLKVEHEKCMNLITSNITNYNTVFITQIYNTNEYEGNVIVYGDDEWDLNDQLINDCENRSTEYIRRGQE